jgi:hypothetical protein
MKWDSASSFALAFYPGDVSNGKRKVNFFRALSGSHFQLGFAQSYDSSNRSKMGGS